MTPRPTLRLAEPPPGWRRSGRAAARSLLLSEQRALALLRQALRAHTDRAASALLLSPSLEASLSLLHRSLPALTAALDGAVLGGRQEARRASLAHFREEWALVRTAVKAAGGADPGALPLSPAFTASDRVAAAAAAAALGAAWLQACSAAPTAEGVAAVPATIDYRLRRTATTEAARAHSAARDEGEGWAARENGGRAWFPFLLKRWDAILDRRVCRVCRELDGATALWGLSFPGGASPGDVHPCCRCYEHTVLLPLPSLAHGGAEGHVVNDETPRIPNAV